MAITGSPNGRCDKRCYYDAIMKNWRDFVREYEHHQNEGATGLGGDNEDNKMTLSPKTPTQKMTTTTPTHKTHSTLLMIMMMTKQMMLEPNKMTPNLLCPRNAR